MRRQWRKWCLLAVGVIVAASNAWSEDDGRTIYPAMDLTKYTVQEFNQAIGQSTTSGAIANVINYDKISPALSGLFKIYGGGGSLGRTSSFTGGDLGNFGLTVGAGKKISREMEIGGLLGYTYGNFTSFRTYGARNTFYDNALRLGGYANYQYENLFANFTPSFGIHGISQHLRGFSEGGKTALDLSLFGQVGYVFELPEGFTFTPSYAVTLGWARHAEATFQSNSGGDNMTIKGYNNWSFVNAFDFRIGRLTQIAENLSLLPELHLAYEREFIAPQHLDVSGTDGLSVKSALDNNRVVFGLAMSLLIGEKYEVSARYDQRVWGSGNSASFGVDVSAKF